MTGKCGIYGLPRNLIMFLRQMETYKEVLKWNIAQGAQKVTLTMTWTMGKPQVTFLDKVKRVLGMSTWSDQGLQIPRQDKPTKSPSSLTKLNSRGLHRASTRICPLCNGLIPDGLSKKSKVNDFDRSKSHWSSWHGPSNSVSFPNKSVSFRTSTPKSDRAVKVMTSAHEVSTCYTAAQSNRQPNTSSASLSESNQSGRSVRLTYRSVEDLEISYEDLFNKVCRMPGIQE